jgi:hypothetical protein
MIATLVSLALLSGAASGHANEIRASNIDLNPNASRRAEFDEACLEAIAFMAESYHFRSTRSARALATVKMCNGHPSRTICEISSQAILEKYGKTPLTCGMDTANSVPLVFPP